MELSTKTVTELSRLLKAREVSSVELATHFLNRILSCQPSNLWVDVNYKLSISQAIEADKLLKSGTSNLLTGIPVAFKDMFASAGWVTSAASPMLSSYCSPFSATAVKRCRTARMVNVGKTNMDEFSMGSSGSQSCWGPTSNASNGPIISGGSSSGSAVAVSSHLVPVALGSDTGGSVRQPSSWNGTVSLKPSYGRISRFGMVSFSSSCDQAGIFGHTVQDCSLLLEVLTGPDKNDGTASLSSGWGCHLSDQLAKPDRIGRSTKPLSGLRIGVVLEHLECAALHRDIRTLFSHSIQDLVLLGAEVVTMKQPAVVLTNFSYRTISAAEASSNLLRYDGIRFGQQSESGTFTLFGSEVQTRLSCGSEALTAKRWGSGFLRAHEAREALFSSFSKVQRNLDVIVLPVCPVLPWPSAKVGVSLTSTLSDAFTVTANLLGLPTVSLPCGFVSCLGRQLPVSFQFLGRPFGEARLIRVAHIFQLATCWTSHGLDSADG